MYDSGPGTTQNETAVGISSVAEAPDVRITTCSRRWLQLARNRLAVAMLVSVASSHVGVQAQKAPENQAASITGVVMDPSSALVPGASVMLLSVGEPALVVSSTRSGERGGYRLDATSGTYIVAVEAVGFATFNSEPIRIVETSGATQTSASARTLNIVLKLATHFEKIEVPVELDSSDRSDGNTLVLRKRDIEQMPLDPTALLDELRGLAGGPDAVLFVSGFSSGKLPPRGNIGQVRIKQNAYSAENDTDPGKGVIEVSTKPGTDQLHGELYLYGNDSALNAANPYAPDQPAYYADGAGGSVSGALNRSASYFVGWDEMLLKMNSAINAQTLDANLNPVQDSFAVRSPRSSRNGSSRLDLRTGANSTMMARYGFDRELQTNGGIGQLALASQGFSNSTVTQTLQIANSQLIGTQMLNETRFQYIRTRVEQSPVSAEAAIVVEGAFLGGGNNLGAFSDHEDRYELQDYLSLAKGHHYAELGGRLRLGRDANHSRANFGGEFIFSSLGAYQATQQMMANHTIAKIRIAGGGPSQFSITAGSSDAVVTIADGGLFLQDDWKVRPNLTLSYGLRFETQSYIADHADWAPRIGFSWSVGKVGAKSAPNYVVRGGAGVFYRRFASGPALLVERENGVTQQKYVIASPQFCPGVAAPTAIGCAGVPDIAGMAAQAGAATTYRVNSNFHAPYYVGESFGLERRLGHMGTASVTYMNSRGIHLQVTKNVNAPLPGTYDLASPASGLRPNGGDQDIYEYASEGVSRSSRLTTNLTLRSSHVNVSGYYMLRFDKSDTESDGSFPSNQFHLGQDYGRSQDDARHTVTLGVDATLPYGFVTWGYLSAMSGTPFNILVGQDLNGDSQFNDRPAFATDLTRASVIATKWGTFDSSPIAGQKIIPRNYGQGPGEFLVTLAMGKTFSVGPELKSVNQTPSGHIPRKYAVELWAESQNAFNHPNLTLPVGTLNSGLFGKSLGMTGGSSLSPARVFDLQLSLRF